MELRIKKIYWGESIVITVSYLILYGSLLQNAIDIATKCGSYFISNATKVYSKIRQVFYYKMRLILLQSVTVITKCDVDYKIH